MILQGFNKDIFELPTTVNINFDTLSEEDKKLAEDIARKNLWTQKPEDSLRLYRVESYGLHPEYNYVLFLHDEYKLTNGTPQAAHLDFTKNDNFDEEYFALIPDYHTKSYLPAYKLK